MLVLRISLLICMLHGYDGDCHGGDSGSGSCLAVLVTLPCLTYRVLYFVH
jgi:hypothetical protein